MWASERSGVQVPVAGPAHQGPGLPVAVIKTGQRRWHPHTQVLPPLAALESAASARSLGRHKR